MQFCTFASGSSGNCLFCRAGETSLLIDAGISRRRIAAGLASIRENFISLGGILITHEHSDHISGLAAVASATACPIYGTRGTIQGLCHAFPPRAVSPDRFHVVIPGKAVKIGEADIMPVPVSHDAADPVGYTISEGKKKLAVLTDLGRFTEDNIQALVGAQVLYVEANHNLSMLAHGPYPASLKKRIHGRKGHLSNDQCGLMVSRAYSSSLREIVLGHLSAVNNTPARAVSDVRQALADGLPLFAPEVARIPVLAAPRDHPSPLIAW